MHPSGEGDRLLPVKIGITNAVLSNTGDAAIFLGVKSILEREMSSAGEDIEIVVFDSNAPVSAAHYPDWHVVQQPVQALPRTSRGSFLVAQSTRTIWMAVLSLFPWIMRLMAARPGRRMGLRSSLCELASCDLVVSTGGTYLVDHYDFTHRYVELRCARALGKPIVLWTQSLGPFRTFRSRWLARGIAACADAVYCRDPASAENWKRATGYRGEMTVVPDSAFALDPVSGGPDQGQQQRAAVSVREWSRSVGGAPFDRSDYVEMMRSSIDALTGLGLTPFAISTCQGVRGYGYDDSVVAAEVFAGLDLELDDDFHTPVELLEILSSCGVVVTTRMHLAILALVSSVPVVAVAYEFKTMELFRSIGLAHAVIAIEDSSSEWMHATLTRLVGNPEDFTLTGERLASLREEAAAPGRLVRSLAEAAMVPPGGSG
jgi:colanic acid/amylovoran biosynthesis protein